MRRRADLRYVISMEVSEMSDEMVDGAKAMATLVDADTVSWRQGLSQTSQQSIGNSDLEILRNKLLALLVECCE